MHKYFLTVRCLEMEISLPPNLIILIEMGIHKDHYITFLHTDKPLYTMQML